MTNATNALRTLSDRKLAALWFVRVEALRRAASGDTPEARAVEECTAEINRRGARVVALVRGRIERHAAARCS